MSTTHTTGRIQFREGGEANQHAMLTEDGRWWLALLANGEMTTERQRANFRRLAACWNACEGISTWALETGPTMQQAYQREEARADKAERERDDLRAALAALVRDADSEPDTEYLQGAGKNRVAVHRNGVERARTALAAHPEAAPACRTVVIPACAEHGGTEAMTLTLPWRCIHCDGPRGEPTMGTSWDGSQQLAVHTWDNPCGHTERYSQVREWAADQIRARTEKAKAGEPAPSAICTGNTCQHLDDPQPDAPYQTKCAKCGDTVPF